MRPPQNHTQILHAVALGGVCHRKSLVSNSGHKQGLSGTVRRHPDKPADSLSHVEACVPTVTSVEPIAWHDSITELTLLATSLL
jgi:hypothetical protein